MSKNQRRRRKERTLEDLLKLPPENDTTTTIKLRNTLLLELFKEKFPGENFSDQIRRIIKNRHNQMGKVVIFTLKPKSGVSLSAMLVKITSITHSGEVHFDGAMGVDGEMKITVGSNEVNLIKEILTIITENLGIMCQTAISGSISFGPTPPSPP